MLTPSFKSWLALGVAVLIWGGSFLATHQLVMEIPPLLAACIRFCLASPLLLGLKFLSSRKIIFPSRAEWPSIALYGLLGVTLCFTFENEALRLTSSGNASIIIGLSPVMTLLAARFFLHERMSLRQWVGIGFATFGTLWLVSAGKSLGLSNSLGDLLMVGALMTGVLANLAGKTTAQRLSPMLNVGYGFGVGALLLIPLAAGEWLLQSVPLQLSLAGWGALFYLTVLASAVSYTAYFYALSHLTLSKATLPLYLTPIVTLLMAASLGIETLTPERGLAALIVVGGLLITGG